MDSVPVDDWLMTLPDDGRRRNLLLGDFPPHALITAVVADVESEVQERKVRPRLEPCDRKTHYERFQATVRLSADTFDLLMNGRMGYRAQYYIGLDQGRSFNRRLIDQLMPLMQRAWVDCGNGNWSTAERSLSGSDSKIWPELDDNAFERQPKLCPTMWVANCRKAKASPIGLHLASTNPPTINLMGTWVSEHSPEPFLPIDKLCRDELLRCFGFT